MCVLLSNLNSPSLTLRECCDNYIFVCSCKYTFVCSCIVDAIRDYRNARLLMTKSKAKDKIASDTNKKILFQLLAAEILTLEFHTEEKKAVFTLARSLADASSFAIHKDEFWSNVLVDLK